MSVGGAADECRVTWHNTQVGLRMILGSSCLPSCNHDLSGGFMAINSENHANLFLLHAQNMSWMYRNLQLHTSPCLIPIIPATPLRRPLQLSVSLKSRRCDLCLWIVNYDYAWATSAGAASLAKQDHLEKPRHSACSECKSEIKLKLDRVSLGDSCTLSSNVWKEDYSKVRRFFFVKSVAFLAQSFSVSRND